MTADDGRPLVHRRRVEIRFSTADPRAYHAKPRNVRLIPGEAPIAFDRLPPGVDPRSASVARTLRRAPRSPNPAHARRAAPAPAWLTAAPTDGWIVHTDASFRGGRGGAGVVVVSPEGEIHRHAVFLGPVLSSMAAEAAALLVGLAMVPTDEPVTFHTDCLSLIDALAWGEPRHWEPPILSELRAALSRFERASLRHVRGHAGHPLNQLADALAGRALRLDSVRE